MEQPKKVRISQAVIVEGKYDKIKLENLIDGYILTTDGFRIFKDREKCELIRKLACQRGVLVITDSDVAGFKIRNHIKSIAKGGKVYHLYIPQIAGKEKRKAVPSKEGTLGVEGLDTGLLRELLRQQGLLPESGDTPAGQQITRGDFLRDGFIGMQNSSEKRGLLLKHLDLPPYLNTKALLGVINLLMSYDEYCAWQKNIPANL